MEKKDDILVCEDCGSRNVQTLAWVFVNKNNRHSDFAGLEDSGNNWCCDCEEHVSLLALSEYEKI
jgi:hypothetical protein